METAELKTLRERASLVLKELAEIAVLVDAETLAQEEQDVQASEVHDETALQKWRVASREIWNAYEACRTISRALAELHWMANALNGDRTP